MDDIGLDFFPDEILLNIMRRLPATDVRHLGETCRRMYQVSMDQHLWGGHLERDFPDIDHTDYYEQAHLRYRQLSTEWIQLPYHLQPCERYVGVSILSEIFHWTGTPCIAAGFITGHVRLLAADDLSCLSEQEVHPGSQVTALVVHEGILFSAGLDRRIMKWDLETGDLSVIDGDIVTQSLAVDQDGRLLAGHFGGVFLWNALGERSVAYASFGIHGCRNLLPTSEYLYTAMGDGPVIVWDPITGERRHGFGPGDPSGDRLIPITEQRVVLIGEKRLQVWDLANLNSARVRSQVRIPGHRNLLTSLVPLRCANRDYVLTFCGVGLTIWDLDGLVVRDEEMPVDGRCLQLLPSANGVIPGLLFISGDDLRLCRLRFE